MPVLRRILLAAAVFSLALLAPAGARAVDLDQCANGPAGAPASCTGAAWVSTSITPANSHYLEGDSVPYAVELHDMGTSGTHTLELEYDTTEGSGKHAFDYLTSFDRTETNALPCQSAGICTGSPDETFPIPADPSLQLAFPAVTQIAGNIAIWNGDITNVVYLRGPAAGPTSPEGSGLKTALRITFTVESSNALIAFGGHLASPLDWGVGDTAGAVSGAPYGMRAVAQDSIVLNVARSVDASPLPLADISVALGPRTEESTILGRTITFTAVVTNNGPDTATGVVLSYTLPAGGLDLVSVAPDQGTCANTNPVACELGDLAAGASATVVIVARAIGSGWQVNTAQAGAAQADPVTGQGSNISTLITPVILPPALLAPPPPPPPVFLPPQSKPVLGETVDVAPVKGEVLVRLKGKPKFVPLKRQRRIPVGSTVDARNGSAKLTSATNKRGGVQTATFYRGTFKVLQRGGALTTIELAGGDFKTCETTLAGRSLAGGQSAAKAVQGLWGTGKGKFRTRGRYSSATVRGTVWFVQDRCDGTFTRVRTGTVEVFDFGRNETVALNAGDTYLAERPG